MIASILGQNLAIAFDFNRFQSLCPEAQQLKSKMRDRISAMSETAKLKLSYQLYKATLKVLPSLDKMSDEDFNAKLQSSIQNNSLNSESADQPVVAIDGTDLDAVLPTDHTVQFNETALTQVRNTYFQQSQMTQTARNLIEKIGYITDRTGTKKPIALKQFKSVAEVDWDSVLSALLSIVVIAAAVGLIVILGWLGVSIILGGLLLTAVIWIIVGLMNFGH